jgi:hypothetical protein
MRQSCFKAWELAGRAEVLSDSRRSPWKFHQETSNLPDMSERGSKSGTGTRVLAAIVFACASVSAHAAGGIVRWVDKDGVTHYSNVPGDAKKQQTTVVATASNPPVRDTRSSIYKYRDGGGVTHYTDRKPRHQNYVVISVYCPACDPKSPVDWNSTRLNLTAYADEVKNAAAANGVDPAFVRAIIHAESAFNSQARSRKGAQGLMQLMPSVASDTAVSDPFDASQNIRGGTKHLAWLLKQFNGDLDLVAAAYNAGAGAVKKYGGIPPYAETQVYVQRVGTLRRRYNAELAATTVAPIAPAVTPVGASGTAVSSALSTKLPR